MIASPTRTGETHKKDGSVSALASKRVELKPLNLQVVHSDSEGEDIVSVHSMCSQQTPMPRGKDKLSPLERRQITVTQLGMPGTIPTLVNITVSDNKTAKQSQIELKLTGSAQRTSEKSEHDRLPVPEKRISDGAPSRFTLRSDHRFITTVRQDGFTSPRSDRPVSPLSEDEPSPPQHRYKSKRLGLLDKLMRLETAPQSVTFYKRPGSRVGFVQTDASDIAPVQRVSELMQAAPEFGQAWLRTMERIA